MYQFNVPDMTCGGCAGAITRALKAEDPNAKVEVSLGQRLVTVQSQLSREEIAQSIAHAGFTPTAA